jgi:hypothetical protein
MRLICDDFQNVYVWVEDHDENIELSPHFDYEFNDQPFALFLFPLMT